MDKLDANRRAAKLPCDGKPRYKVGKLCALTYSLAYDAIMDESILKESPRILKKGTLNRLYELNRTYFRVASFFVNAEIEKMQQAVAVTVQDKAVAAIGFPNDADLIGGTTIQPSTEPVKWAPPDLSQMPVGEHCHIREVGKGDVGMLYRNKGGYRCIIDGHEARSRNAVKMQELIFTALSEAQWTIGS